MELHPILSSLSCHYHTHCAFNPLGTAVKTTFALDTSKLPTACLPSPHIPESYSLTCHSNISGLSYIYWIRTLYPSHLKSLQNLSAHWVFGLLSIKVKLLELWPTSKWVGRILQTPLAHVALLESCPLWFLPLGFPKQGLNYLS